MPFFLPYINSFKQHDVIYGLKETRSSYAYKYKRFKKSQSIECISTIDQYAVTDAELQFKKNHHVKIANYQYEFITFIESREKYNLIRNADVKFDPNPRMSAAIPPTETRKKIKAGLDFFSHHHFAMEKRFFNKPRQPHIHFLLDGINMRGVAKKERYGKSFTSVELR